MRIEKLVIIRGSYIFAFQLVHSSNFPQPPTVTPAVSETPRVSWKPCYGYSQSHISTNGSHHNQSSIVRAKIASGSC